MLVRLPRCESPSLPLFLRKVFPYLAGFIQEEEYERRKQNLAVARKGVGSDLIQQSAAVSAFAEAMPVAEPSVPEPKRAKVAVTIASAPVAVPPASKFRNEVNPFIYTEDYSKITTPVVFVSTEGWKKERDNSGEPDTPSEDLVSRWKALQNAYADKVKTSNSFEWTTDLGKPNTLKLIGGLDISFPKGNKIDAVVCLAVTTYPDNKLVFVAYKMIKLTAPCSSRA